MIVLGVYALFLGLLVVAFTIFGKNSVSNVLGTTDIHYEDSNTVNINAYIQISSLRYRVFPEKRIPRTGNWSTYTNLVLVNCTNGKTYTFNNILTDKQGYGTIPLNPTITLSDGPYRFYIKGYSHLNMRFNCYSINSANTLIDFTKEGKELFAGEVSVIYDNYINALDMSVLERKIYTNDYGSDLNQDGMVNSLDFSNQIFNLYMHGD